MAAKHELKTIEDLKPAPYNPRRQDDASALGLRESLEEFGDLSGITWNKQTGNLVCGHQRVKQLKELGAQVLQSELRLSKWSFHIRIVDWSLGKEMAANVAANNQLLAGVFTDDLGDLLAKIEAELGEDRFSDLRFDMLDVKLPDFQPVGADEQSVLGEPKKCPECGYVFVD